MRTSLLLAALGLVGCAAPASVTLGAGPVHAMFSATDLALPAGLRDASSMPARLMSVPCGPTAPMAACPTFPGPDAIVLECTAASVCDPMPITVESPVGDVIDIDMASGDLRGVLSVIDSIEVTEIHELLTDETLTFDIGAVDVYWATEGATTADPANHLAVLPPVPMGTPAGPLADATIDPSGSAGLSNYLAHTSHRVRLFARTTVDLAPGALFPDGSLGVDVTVTLVAHGRIAG